MLTRNEPLYCVCSRSDSLDVDVPLRLTVYRQMHTRESMELIYVHTLMIRIDFCTLRRNHTQKKSIDSHTH